MNEESPTEKFVQNMTNAMFKEFWEAMTKRYQLDDGIKVYLNSKYPNNNEILLIKSGRWIEAIKSLRTRLNMGLKEAKDIVDKYRRDNNL